MSAPELPAAQPPGPAGTNARRERAVNSAQLALSLSELLRTGALLPDVFRAIADRRQQAGDPLAPLFDRMARGIRDDGLSLFEVVVREKRRFTSRFMAYLALANLNGQVLRACIGRLRGMVRRFNELPAGEDGDFPPLGDEVLEFCHLFGHLTREKASQSAIQQWLPQVFTARLRLPATLVLGRFYDQGLLLSEAFQKTPPFDDPEMVLAVQAGEELNRVGEELIELADWLDQRRRLEERLRWNDLVLSRSRLGDGPPPPEA